MREGALSCHISSSSSSSNSPPYFSSTIDSTHLESMVASPSYRYDPVDVSSCPTVVPESQCQPLGMILLAYHHIILTFHRYDHVDVSLSHTRDMFSRPWSYLCHTDVPLSPATATASAIVDESSDSSKVTITPPATHRILSTSAVDNVS